MTIPSDNETWLIEEGDKIIRKEASQGASSLSPWERLVYCLWVADYGMRNAGDLETASDLYPDYKTEGLRLAQSLNMGRTLTLFGAPTKDMEKTYFSLFELVCDELKAKG